MNFEQLLRQTYAAFNSRDIDGALEAMHPDVCWANGLEGGTVHGYGGVRAYWTRQWGKIDPTVELVEVRKEGDGRFAVMTRLVVRDLKGKLLMNQMVQHVYEFEGGLIRSMVIRELEGRGGPASMPRSNISLKADEDPEL